MEYDTKAFDQMLAKYRASFNGTAAEFNAAVKTATMYTEPSGCKDESPAKDFFSYLSDELEA